MSHLINIYPHPANAKLYIKNIDITLNIEKLTLFNSLGKEIFTNEIKKTNTKLFQKKNTIKLYNQAFLRKFILKQNIIKLLKFEI